MTGDRHHGTHNCAVHGPDRRYTGRRCHCDPCRAANADYEAQRKQRIEPAYVDAQTTRDHIAWLSANGVGLKTLANISGVSHGALWKLVYGAPGRSPSKRTRPATRDAILAVRPDQGADRAYVDANPTWTTIGTLIDRGWTKAAIARAIGQNGPGLQVGRATVTRATARTIAALLDQPVPPRRSRHGTHPVPQPKVDPDQQLRDEARRLQAAERQAVYRATKQTTPVDYEPPTVDLPFTTTGAPCRRPEVPVWLFFPDPGDHETEARAKAVCARCKYADRCAEYAIAHHETGVWGGLADADRDRHRNMEHTRPLTNLRHMA